MDSTVRDALERFLPETEPPMRLQLGDVIKHGRRRRRLRTLAPACAAVVVVALMIGSALVATDPPPPAEWPPAPTPIGTTTVPTPSPSVTTVPQIPTGQQPTSTLPGTPSGSTSPSLPGLPGVSTTPPVSGPPATTTPAPAGPLYEFRAPPGHKVNWAAQGVTDYIVAHMPANRITLYYGTASDAKDGGDRYAVGGHMLWQDGATYGYLYWMHRTEGYFPVTEYGLPAEPCVDPARPAPGETCVTRPRAEDGGVDVLFDIDRGYRLRGVVQHRKDLNGGADMAVTLGFYLPRPGGAWPQFPNLSGQPPLASFPYTVEQLSHFLSS